MCVQESGEAEHKLFALAQLTASSLKLGGLNLKPTLVVASADSDTVLMGLCLSDTLTTIIHRTVMSGSACQWLCCLCSHL